MNPWKQLTDIGDLRIGDRVSNVGWINGSALVTECFGERAIAVRVFDITNASEWAVFRSGPSPVRLRKHPDGHWIPDTPGEWDYRQHYESMEGLGVTTGGLPAPLRVTVYEYQGGLNVRFPEGREESTRIVAPGTWEWVTPTGDATD